MEMGSDSESDSELIGEEGLSLMVQVGKSWRKGQEPRQGQISIT